MSVDFTKVPSPCFVLEESLLRRNLEIISYVQKEAGVKIILAFKGFAMWSAFDIIKEYGIETAAASSVDEARLCFEEMKAEAHTYSPAYKENDLKEIINYSSHISFNSLAQFNKSYRLVRNIRKSVSLGLRINPGFSEVEPMIYNACSPGSRLGVTAEQLPDQLPEGIDGLHFHTLCESTSYDLEKTLDAVKQKFGKYFYQIKWINMGGGHLMTRKDYDIAHLISILKAFKMETNLEIILEPGSAFAWETGYLVSQVLDVFDNKGIKTAILDVSFTCHMPDCLEMPYQPRILGAESNNKGKHVYRMGGNSCLSGDYMGFWSFENELKPYDLVIFDDMIHYTMVKTTFFNGMHHPSIGIWNEKSGFKLVREFSYLDYKGKLS
jgi:carboxynorspermidine decarboxylase